MFVSREIYSYPTLYPIHCDAGWIFIIFLSAQRDIEVANVFLSSAASMVADSMKLKLRFNRKVMIVNV